MVLKFTGKASELAELEQRVVTRMRRSEEDSKDICLAGSTSQVIDKLGELRDAGVDTLFFPSMFSTPEELRDECDRFMEDVAGGFR